MGVSLSVGELEGKLFNIFPRFDAEDWDQPGLAVGRIDEEVGKVAVALDMSVENVIRASDAGCNVLVCHHPPFIGKGPVQFGPECQMSTTGPGRMVYEAASLNVSTIAMHTNLDRAVAVRDAYARLLGCTCLGNCECLFDPGRASDGKGFGAVLIPDWNAAPTLGLLADLCERNFSCKPRVWGDSERIIERIAFLNGSWGEPGLYEGCIEAGVDCVIVGETKYHLCADSQPYLSFIELGHDRSELPLVGVLIDALVECGIDEEDIVDLRPYHVGWWTA